MLWYSENMAEAQKTLTSPEAPNKPEQSLETMDSGSKTRLDKANEELGKSEKELTSAKNILEEKEQRKEELQDMDMHSWYAPEKVPFRPSEEKKPTILEKFMKKPDDSNHPPMLPKEQLLSNKVAELEKKFAESVKEKHNAEIAEVISKMKLSDIDVGARKNTYSQMIENNVKYESIQDLENKKVSMRKQLDNPQFKKLTPEEQEKKIKERIIAAEVDELVDELEKFKKL